MTVEFIPLRDAHLDAAFALTQKLQWPHRPGDWQQALLLGEGIAAVENGELIGTLITWRWGVDYSTLGLVIVDDAQQGRGIGKQLMLAGLETLAGSNIRLHATEAGKGLYEKLGFVATGHVEQHQCRLLPAVAAPACAAHQQIRSARQQDATLLTALDRQATGQQRPRLIANLLESAERILVLEEQGAAAGFACLRRFGHGYAIGPVTARTPAAAKLLIGQLLSTLGGQFVRIDTDREAGIGPWLTEQGLPEVDAPTTMIKGTPWRPESGGMQAFGLMSQAMA
ncbi:MULTISPECIES: GNAT family N-acetyltransferase [unclassified Erwinia]|uniref:GNAT family N-acetyltransferase n=1 Tax=unclassified Erwinia TaxID=2622719 RepID=UPI000700EA02|nr:MULTISPECIES: GNAT family N-acetyltransferase [unclassified Erwinia]KQN63511.1 histone acetyltransferase [Erwinia sp. Leaf53]PLV51631.1 histone acetyltransferase [Erwinia sp. B116]